jgi:acyl-coenzyme A synthetase/AMP-(fatty) acid ligase
LDENAVRLDLMKKLPQHMVPSRIHTLRTMPLNNNGKVDRNALLRMLNDSVIEKEAAS